MILFNKLSGFLFFGIIPLTFVYFFFDGSFSIYGINNNELKNSLYHIFGTAPILILLSYLYSGKETNYKIYPQIRKLNWDFKLVVLNVLGWMLYLCAYEFMLRGLLLFISIENIGLYGAVIFNTIIYALAHIPKGIKETVGSIPVGLLFCFVTIQTGNVFPAIILHLTLALSNDLFSFRANPEMKYIRKLSDKLDD